MEILHTPIDKVPLRHRRIFERVSRLVDDDVHLAGSVAINLMIDVIFTEVEDRDPQKMDTMIDAIAEGLKRGCRDCAAADRAKAH